MYSKQKMITLVLYEKSDIEQSFWTKVNSFTAETQLNGLRSVSVRSLLKGNTATDHTFKISHKNTDTESTRIMRQEVCSIFVTFKWIYIITF